MKKYPLCGAKGNIFFSFYNYIVKACNLGSFPICKIDEPKKILLSCPGQLGDVFLASHVIPSLYKKWPSVQIGFLTLSQSVLALGEGITWVHEVETWNHVIKNQGIKSGIQLLFSSKNRRAIQDIRELGYDISIELHPFFPNGIPFAKEACIPIRVGFDSTAYDIWLTHKAPFPSKLNYLPTHYQELLREIGIAEVDIRLDDKIYPLACEQIKNHSYLVLHIGSSDARKQWPWQSWRELAMKLIDQGYFLVFTGKGEEENALIQKITDQLPSTLNLSNHLSWEGLCSVIQCAQVLISVDSAPVHIASALRVPFVALYLYNHIVELWIPNTSQKRAIVSTQCKWQGIPEDPRAILADEIQSDFVYHQLRMLLEELKPLN